MLIKCQRVGCVLMLPKNMLTWSGTVWELMEVYCETATCQHMLWQCCLSKQKWELAAGVKNGKTPTTTTVFAEKHYPTESRDWYHLYSKKKKLSKISLIPRRSKLRQGVISGCPVASGMMENIDSEAPSKRPLLLMNALCAAACQRELEIKAVRPL